jgi:hypothetical protein
MNGYQYWVQRHRLTVWLEEQKQKAAQLPDAERLARTLEAEREFRVKLDALYVQVRTEFESPAKA